MAPPERGRRAEDATSAPPPEIRRSTRNTRQASAQSTAAHQPEPAIERTETQKFQTNSGVISRLATVEPARRGARPRASGSEMSIGTRQGDSDDEDQTGTQYEVEDSDNNGDDESEAASAQVKQKIMALSLPDLLKASQDWMQLLKVPNGSNDPVLQARLRMKRNAFLGVRECYDEDTPFFLEVAALAEQIPPTGSFKLEPFIVLEHSNLTAALGLIEMLHEASAQERLDIANALDNLSEYFPFSTSNNEYSLHVHLAIRTIAAIETLAVTPTTADPLAVVAGIFYGEVYRDPESALVDGPFLSLAGRDDPGTQKVCAQRVRDIVAIVKKRRRDFGVGDLRAKFPADKLLEDFKQWILTVYKTLDDIVREEESGRQSRAEPIQQEESQGDYDDEIADSVAGSDSQPIVRATETQAMAKSLYTGPDSRRFLDERFRQSSRPPPSNQEQERAPPGAPKDYPNHTAADLLSENPIIPASSGAVRSEPGARQQADTLKRKRAATIEEDAESSSEDDDFEVISVKTRPAHQTAPPLSAPSQRQRRSVASSSRTAALSDALSMPPPPVPGRSQAQAPAPESSGRTLVPHSSADSSFSSFSSSQADFAAVKRQKVSLSQEARRYRAVDNRSALQKRHAWDDEDCNTLIELVRERQASWTEMERSDGHRFIHPRNQQAYRDKARNMKVDFLLTDVVLPPGFDLVALGKKEIDRVVGMGKNPNRREKDVDFEGNPIGTELREEM